MPQDQSQQPQLKPMLPHNAELIAEFIAQADVADSTKVKYRAHMDEFERWYQHVASGDADLKLVRPGDVNRFMAYLRSGNRYASSGAPRTAQNPAASTRKTFFASITVFYRYLVSVELVASNPTDSLDAPKVQHKPGMRLTAEEIGKLLAVRGQPRERVQAFLLTFTGARAREIQMLRWRDVDWNNHTLQLLGKGGKYRVLDIHPRLMSELRRWQLFQEEQAFSREKLRVALSHHDTAFVLLTRNGKPLSHSAIGHQLKSRAKKAGLYLQTTTDRFNVSEIHPHALRRSLGTILLNDGHHLDAVADVLGHASVDTTRKHYAFSSTERRKATIRGYNV